MGYKINIAGCERELDIFELNEQLDIAGFIMFSDVEVTIASAKAILEKAPEFDIILTAECKDSACLRNVKHMLLQENPLKAI